ncbi:IS110 family transposase [Reichenbachiella carrageenanivorans]|uniref:IS110 family transposase n=1 Tax=Reichenbachiella carrageenanivorans TaxID=2979869 RepID=A0ABY6D332_9BACT|nr:IS110 family transposase [Reichenbachiella carrageenanivorans]UXX79468.1 IS110 family transposase [Reichenbachiella carrageenanivorans]UXX79493.1 IS110 family transposase [Reichenbachiella carrageenanivorans]
MENTTPKQIFYPHIVGIDISKMSIDVALINSSSMKCNNGLFSNDSEGFQKMKRWLKQHGNDCGEDILFCMEHTGIYTRNIVKYLLKRGCKVWLESSLHIKRSMGLIRGKSDKIDAERIANFAFDHQRDAKLVKLSHPTLNRLKDLMKTRMRLQKSLHSQQIAVDELTKVDPKAGREIERISRSAISGLKKSLDKVEAKMDELIQIDKHLKTLYELVTSVKSVGKVLAVDLIVYTEGFTRMLDNRKLACYCGVAPFEYSSGTSIFASPGTSSFANKQLKFHLHMCAMNAIKCHKELRGYYLRKTEEGKSKMSALNAVRNKLLHRVVAVVKRGTPYQEKLD